MLEIRTHRRLGWKAPLPDHRRPRYRAFLPVLADASLPSLVDLRPGMPGVYDQEELGSCVPNALAGGVQYLLKKEGKPDFTPSRLWLYYNCRAIDGTVKQDAGTTVADGVQVLQRLGAPPESLWWYNVAKFAVKPNKKVYDAALPHKLVRALSLDNTNINELRTVLASGSPFAFGISVFDSFMSDEVARSGVVPMPGKAEGMQGGHCCLAVGYDHDRRQFIARNSWGTGWGLKGYFEIPYDYLTSGDLCDDCWSLGLTS